jgi:hypothetical protein
VGCWADAAGTLRRTAAHRAAVRARLVGMDFIYHRGGEGVRGEAATLIEWEISSYRD